MYHSLHELVASNPVIAVLFTARVVTLTLTAHQFPVSTSLFVWWVCYCPCVYYYEKLLSGGDEFK